MPLRHVPHEREAILIDRAKHRIRQPTRSNGLLSMVKQMRMYALAFKAKGI